MLKSCLFWGGGTVDFRGQLLQASLTIVPQFKYISQALSNETVFLKLIFCVALMCHNAGFCTFCVELFLTYLHPYILIYLLTDNISDCRIVESTPNGVAWVIGPQGGLQFCHPQKS